jgi:hypothetical protein
MRDDDPRGGTPTPVDDEETDRLVAKFAARQLGAEPAPESLTIGRYVRAEAHTNGGMGRIFVAYDPGLDRHVAIKALPVGLAPSEPDAALPEREGKALARIDHPNVVRVFDLVEHRGTTCLVLERIEGLNLAQWLRVRARAWPEVLTTYLAAGDGLVAVHRAGFVHRDVKPPNILVSDAGVVKLIDFGLAVRTGTAPDDGAGTPRYMAPEQIAGRALDPRADQFAFCVALYEALFAAHPFLSRDIAPSVEADEADVFDPDAEQATRRTVLEQIRGGQPRRPERLPPGLPPHILPALLRGLSPAPDARFPTMHALLLELRRDPKQTRRRVLTVLGALGLAVGTYLGLRAEACPSIADEQARLWNGLRDDITRHLAPFGPGAMTTVEAAVRDQAEQQHDACQTRNGGERKDTDDARDACLHTRAAELTFALRELHGGGADVRARLVRGLAERPSTITCNDPARLRYSCLDDGAAAFARAKASAAMLARDFDRAEALAGEALQAADRTGRIGARALTHLLLGRIAYDRGDHPRARWQLSEAEALAESSNCLAYSGEIYHRLVKLAAFDALIPLARGEDWSRMQEFRSSDADVAARADVLNDRGLFAERRRNDLERAESLQRQAIALRQPTLDRTIGQADSFLNLTSVLYNLGRVAEARVALHEADTRRKEVLGATHPDLAKHLLTHAALEIQVDNLPLARELLDQGLEYARPLGPTAQVVADIHHNRSLVLDRLGDAAGAIAAVEDELAALAGRPDADPLWNDALVTLGQVQLGGKRFADALETFGKVEERHARLGATEAERGVVDFSKSDALAHLGRLTEAEARARQALERFDAAHLPADADVRAHANLLYGEALSRQDRWQEAVAPLERAVAVWKYNGLNPIRLARARWALAEAACRLPGPHSDLQQIVEEARSALRVIEGNPSRHQEKERALASCLRR